MISVFIPVFNEEGLLEQSALRVHEYLSNAGLEHEVVVVSNGSTDETVPIGTRLDREHEWFHFYAIDKKGAGRAFKLGIAKAKGEHVITLDADLSSELLFMDYAAHLLPYSTMVIGSKTMGTQRRTLLRVFGSQLYISFSQYFFDIPITDFSIGCKAFRREDVLPVLEHLDNWTGYIFELCLFFKMINKKVVQIGIDCDDNRTSRFSLAYEGYYRYRHLYQCYRRLKEKGSWLNTITGAE